MALQVRRVVTGHDANGRAPLTVNVRHLSPQKVLLQVLTSAVIS